VHLGMASANVSGIQGYASNFKSSLSEHDAVQMVRGIKMYQQHSFSSADLPSEEIWSDGVASVRKPVLKNETNITAKHPFLLIPSLINKANILDISEERSMLRWFNENGIETYLLDWGDLSKTSNIEILIKTTLCEAIRGVSEVTDSKVDVLGYCMGGTMLMGAHIFALEHIGRMILLAAPWDFNVTSSSLARNVRIWSPAVLPVIAQRGHLPSDWVQALFASLDPNGSAQKFIKFASMDQSGSDAKLFVAVEDWLNDGVDLPKDIAQHCIQDWFIDNALALGRWRVGDEIINTEEIDAQILILASNNDRLVPFECAANITNNLSFASVKVIELDCGHVGLIVGRNAVETVWQPILNWLEK